MRTVGVEGHAGHAEVFTEQRVGGRIEQSHGVALHQTQLLLHQLHPVRRLQAHAHRDVIDGSHVELECVDRLTSGSEREQHLATNEPERSNTNTRTCIDQSTAEVIKPYQPDKNDLARFTEHRENLVDSDVIQFRAFH